MEDIFPNDSEMMNMKIILGGRYGVGKTSLRRNFMGGSRFKRNYLPTIGSDFSYKEITKSNKKLRVLIWDLAGEVRFRQFRSLYFQGASGALLVFDLTDRTSFDTLDEWVSDLINQTTTEGVPIVILGNKSDLILDESEQCVTSKEIDAKIKEFEKQLDNRFDLSFIKTSALSGENVEEAFHKLIDNILIWNPGAEIYQ